MKSLLKLTRSCIHKSLGIIHKGLVFGKILDNRVLIGTHHKTGAVWMSSIFNSVASYYDWKFYANRGNKYLIFPSSNFDIFFQYQSYFDFQKLYNYTGLHLIRDPIDIIVSGFFIIINHQKNGYILKENSFEAWLINKN